MNAKAEESGNGSLDRPNSPPTRPLTVRPHAKGAPHGADAAPPDRRTTLVQVDAGNFDVGDLLHDDFICEWPQSGECINGRTNFVAVNAHYPRRVRINVQRILVAGDTVITEITAPEAADATNIDRAISFFDFRDGFIVHLREFWPDPIEAADWRAQWVERI